ncbi:MAG: B3/4 domain-containing protein [Anaerolineae bacterium]
MRYIIDMAIFGTLPDYTRVVLVARELDNTQNAVVSRNMLSKAEQTASTLFEEQAPTEHPPIASWQRAYEAFGILSMGAEERRSRGTGEQGSRGARDRPIPAQLYLRTDSTPLTDTLNAFALQNLLPVGGDDLDMISGNVWLRPARGTELFIPIGRPERPETPDIGEIVYVDDAPNVLQRCWHGHQGDTTRITPQTRNALVYLDCLLPIDRAMAEELAGKLTRLVSGFFGAQVETYYLTRQQPAVKIEDV